MSGEAGERRCIVRSAAWALRPGYPCLKLALTPLGLPTEPVYYTSEGAGGADSYPPDKPGDCSPNCYMQTPERCFAAQSTRHSETLLCYWSPVDPSFRALSGRLKFTVRRHKFNKDSLQMSCARQHSSRAPARSRLVWKRPSSSALLLSSLELSDTYAEPLGCNRSLIPSNFGGVARNSRTF